MSTIKRACVSLPFAAFIMGLLIFPGTGKAQVENGLEFLNIPVGVRASGMGGAFVAVADDASATYWNPAGLSQVQPQILFAHNAFIVDMKQEYLSFTTEYEDWTIGASFNILDAGTLEKRDESGELLGEFRPLDLSLGVSVAYPVLHDTEMGVLSLGATAKGVFSDIDVETATGYLFDAGALWDAPIEGFTFGFAVRNIGPSLTFISEPFDPPLNVRGGVAYRVYVPSAESNLVLSFDFESMRGGETRSYIGGEWYYGEYITGRVGITPNSDSQDFTTGFGAHYRSFIVDYGYIPYTNDLGNSHRIGVTYLFNR